MYYDPMDLRCLWYKPLSYVDKDIEAQQKKTQEASDELREASNSYEMTPFNGMSKSEAAVLERGVDRLTAEYQKQKTNLENLYAERKRLEDEKYSVPSDIFKLVYLKCRNLLPVVGKYYKKPVETIKEQSGTTELFLPMSLVAPIHGLCNGNQFENVSSIDFFHALNLQPYAHPLEVCKNQKVRVCYLINQLSEKIKPERHGEWIEAILRSMGIAPDYYRSKYREPVNDMPSKKNKEFAEALKEILG